MSSTSRALKGLKLATSYPASEPRYVANANHRQLWRLRYLVPSMSSYSTRYAQNIEVVLDGRDEVILSSPTDTAILGAEWGHDGLAHAC